MRRDTGTFFLGFGAVLGLFTLAAHFDEQDRQGAATLARQATHKRIKALCQPTPCLDPAPACYVHGGAPQSPGCPRD